MRILRFLRDWALAVSVAVGAAAYFIYASIPALDHTHRAVQSAVSVIQPVLIFLILFVSFCRVRIADLRYRPWEPLIMTVQLGMFLLGTALLLWTPIGEYGLLAQCAMLMFICPTAAAAMVVTVKLGGHAGPITLYTILSNLLTAIMIPLVVPLIHPVAGQTFLHDFSMIMARVFPMLVCPLLLAMIMRRLWPRLTERIGSMPDLAFYLWVASLSIATAVTVKTLVHSHTTLFIMLCIALISLVACSVQFFVGKRVGRRWGEAITAGQSLGQKNTVFAIWLGYTFLMPATSLAGGFYLIFQNIFNSWQLWRHSKTTE